MRQSLARGCALRPALSPHAALDRLQLARCLQLLAVSRAMRSVVVEAGEQVGSEDAQLWVVRSGTAVRLGNGRSKVRHITACHHRVSLSKEDRCSRVVVWYTRPQEEQPEEEEEHVLGPRSCLSSEEEGGPWQVRALTRLEVGSTLLPGRQVDLLLSSPNGPACPCSATACQLPRPRRCWVHHRRAAGVTSRWAEKGSVGPTSGPCLTPVDLKSVRYRLEEREPCQMLASRLQHMAPVAVVVVKQGRARAVWERLTWHWAASGTTRRWAGAASER